MRLLLLFLYLLLLYAFPLAAQEYSYTHYDTKDGLASSTVHGMVQSKDGFIWFATETGLSRFDGLHFKNYTTSDGLPANEILSLRIDSKGRLWLFPFKKELCYVDQGKIHTAENDSVLRKIRIRDAPLALAESDKGDFIIPESSWTHVITADKRVYTLPVGVAIGFNIPSPLRFRIISQKISLPPNLVDLPDEIRKKAQSSRLFNGATTIDGVQYYLFQDGNTFRLIGRDKTRAMQLQSNPYRTIVMNGHEIALCHLMQGVEILDLLAPSTSHLYLPEYLVQYVMKDIEGNLWFATKGSGVFKVSSNKFKELFSVNEKGTTYIRSINKVGQDIIIGGFNDKYWKCKPADTFFFHSNEGYRPEPFLVDDHFLRRLPRGISFQPGSTNFIHLNIIATQKTVQVLGDTLLIASHLDAGLFSLKQKKCIQKLFFSRTTCAYKQENSYFIGTLDGLYRVGPEGKSHYLGDSFPAFSKEISFLTEDSHGVLWVGSNGLGVWGYKDGSICASFHQGNGLVSNLCRCLFTQGNQLWIGTEKGLNKADITPGRYHVVNKVTTGDGLNSNIINAILCDSNYVYVGTPVGVTVFDESRLRTHGIIYLNMTDITVSGRRLDPQQQDIWLSHQDNNISFAYCGISFLSEGDITYKYRVLGLNDQWKLTREPILTYPSLPSGDYTLELIAINKYKDQSKPLRYHFRIEKSLPEMLWFKIVIAVASLSALILIIYFIVRNRHKKATQKLMLEHKINSLEQMALRAQMNPHFIFNCLNSIQEYILQGDIRKTNLYLSRFASLVRDTLNNSTRVYITLEQELKYLRAYIDLEQMKQADQFYYEIRVDPGIDPRKITIPNMVLQPYIENAIKHGTSQADGPGKLVVWFHLYPEPMLLECIIEDNGPGILHSQQARDHTNHHPSKGMSITDKRIAMLNQLYPGSVPIRIQVTDTGAHGTQTGTRITIHFPI